MSKRSEEAALKAYPNDSFVSVEYADMCRSFFQEGYELAEKDTLERVILWLKNNANKYIVDIGLGYGEHGRNMELIVGGKCWEDLKKAMEEEQ